MILFQSKLVVMMPCATEIIIIVKGTACKDCYSMFSE